MLKFDEKSLVAKLEKLRPMNRVAFAASCAGRLLPVCLLFADKYGVGNKGLIGNALDFVWDAISQGDFSLGDAQDQLDSVMQTIPDDDDGWTPLHPYAQDGLSALAFSMTSLLENGSPQESAWAARRVYVALDHFVINENDIDPIDAETERLILSNPVIQQELVRQSRDIKELEAVDSEEAIRGFVEMSRVRCKNEAVLMDMEL